MNQERHKYQCAVRQLLIYRKHWGLAKFREWTHFEKNITFWLKHQDDFVIQWRLGNRGEKDRWL